MPDIPDKLHVGDGETCGTHRRSLGSLKNWASFQIDICSMVHGRLRTHLYLCTSTLLSFVVAERLATQIHAPDFALRASRRGQGQRPDTIRNKH